jgi:hypothetical protein
MRPSTLGLLTFPALATIALAASAATQVVVVGKGNPDIDVPAVQAAVDQGGDVILKGHFSFNRPPTVPTALTGYPPATVLVWKAVTISGARGADHEMTSIEAGTFPFYVAAPGAPVTIQGLRFIRPKGDAILVYSVSGLVIASCKIEGVEPENIGDITTSTAIEVNTSGINPPNPTSPGKPENISGTLLIVNNDIDVAGGTALSDTLGVLIWSVGVPGAEVEAYVSENKIRNTTEPAINFRRIDGRAYIERNVVATGSVVAPAPRPQAIRVVNTGSYLIADNSIDCGWSQADAEGIGVFSQFAAWPIEGAFVVDNDVNMSAPESTVFGNFSAGIGVYGFAQGNVVLNNKIRGRASAALSMPVFPLPPQVPAVPANNEFVHNRVDDFEASVADVFVGPSATNTRIVGPGTVEDLGIGTVIVPLRSDHDDCSHRHFEKQDDFARGNLAHEDSEGCRGHAQP